MKYVIKAKQQPQKDKMINSVKKGLKYKLEDGVLHLYHVKSDSFIEFGIFDIQKIDNPVKEANRILKDAKIQYTQSLNKISKKHLILCDLTFFLVDGNIKKNLAKAEQHTWSEKLRDEHPGSKWISVRGKHILVHGKEAIAVGKQVFDKPKPMSEIMASVGKPSKPKKKKPKLVIKQKPTEYPDVVKEPSVYDKKKLKPYLELYNKKRYDKLFKGKDRVYLDLDLNIKSQKARRFEDLTNRETEQLSWLSLYLYGKGYDIKDIDKGIAESIKTKREIRIGKLLKDRPDLLNKYQVQKPVIGKDVTIAISRHPYDIATMSTDRGWKSCMNLEGGENKHYVARDVNHGTLIAYLVNEHDLDIKHPIGRVLVKPFFNADNSDDFYLIPENIVYGTVPNEGKFLETVKNWVDENHNKDKHGIYDNYADLYNDSLNEMYKIYDKRLIPVDMSKYEMKESTLTERVFGEYDMEGFVEDVFTFFDSIDEAVLDRVNETIDMMDLDKNLFEQINEIDLDIFASDLSETIRDHYREMAIEMEEQPDEETPIVKWVLDGLEKSIKTTTHENLDKNYTVKKEGGGKIEPYWTEAEQEAKKTYDKHSDPDAFYGTAMTIYKRKLKKHTKKGKMLVMRRNK